ncbi:MAG TPA: 30S ribosomal protein S3ae [Candidatus Lokiarchaeia archaeon]|nr:30S ribosomal protein S3ae [Candidatus Lokiarchaeia archaeon]
MSKVKGKRSKRQVDTWKTKEWYDVYAPKMFQENYIGQIPSSTPDTLPTRIIETILYFFTDRMEDISTKLRFKVTSVTGTKCTSQFYGHDTTRDYIRSMVRRGSSRVDGIFAITTGDGVKMRISVSIFTNGRAKASQQTTMRKIMHDVLVEHANAEPFPRFVHGLVFGRIGRNINNIAKEIYTIRECKVRKSKVLSPAEDLPDANLADTEADFQEVLPSVKKHRKSILKKLVKEAKEAAEEMGEDLDEPKSKDAGKEEEPGEDIPMPDPENE